MILLYIYLVGFTFAPPFFSFTDKLTDGGLFGKDGISPHLMVWLAFIWPVLVPAIWYEYVKHYSNK